MKRSLEGQVDELYRLPLADFTKARNTLARSLSGSEKKAVGSVAKPTVPMWVINQLHWEDASTYRALVDAAEKLRSAHRSALSGRNTDTRKPDELHRTTVEKAFAKAMRIAENHGLRLTDTVRNAIRRTLSALPGDEPAGRLTKAPEPAGFSLLTGIKVTAPPKIREPRLSAAERQKQRLAEQEKKEAEQKARKEEAERQQEIRKAEQALRDAERRLAELKG